MGKKYLPVHVGNLLQRVYLEDLHRIHRFIKKTCPLIPPYSKLKINTKTSLETQAGESTNICDILEQEDSFQF